MGVANPIIVLQNTGKCFQFSIQHTVIKCQKIVYLKPRIHERIKWLANHSQTKCAYVWTGLRTCAALSANGSHTVCRVPKFVGFCGNTKRTGCVGCPFRAPGVLCSPQVHGKLINRTPNMRRTRTLQYVSGALMYTRFKAVELELEPKLDSGVAPEPIFPIFGSFSSKAGARNSNRKNGSRSVPSDKNGCSRSNSGNSTIFFYFHR